MSDESWIESQALFADVVDLPAAERKEMLDARCAGRPALRAEVESLLASHDDSSGFMHLAAEGVESPFQLPAPESGQTVGRFRLLERIGAGGMGVVYRAERADGEFIEQVAVKLIAVPLHDREALRRFRIERQALATLNHPDIVALVDGGVTPTGQAYLAMKYVDGVPITQYCAAGALPLDERLRLFQRVCAAVQYAHQNGVVHRDLKPANILVTPEGLPKVLDFGVAKLLDGPGSAANDRTRTEFLKPMTINYASPEQLRGMPVTIACDVYALGVVLYELLAGNRPYDVSGETLDVVLAIVGEREPRRPSAAAARDRLPYGEWRLKGDLDAIVLKAMHKEPTRRYASAQELSDDIARHLAAQPIVAREPSLAYVAARLARRHRAAVVAAGISALALVAALGVSLWQTRVARAERDRATARFNDARQLANALIFKIHDEVRPLPGSTPVRRSIVAEALTYLERLSADPAADAVLRVELARGYLRVAEVQGYPNTPNLGDREGALMSARKAVALLDPLVSDDTFDRDAALVLGRARITFSRLARVSGAREEALDAMRKAVAVAEALAARYPRDRDARHLQGSTRYEMAFVDPPGVRHWQRAGEVFESLLAEQPDNPDRQRDVALVEKYLGGHYQATGDLNAALRHHARALDLDRRRAESDPKNRQAQLDLAIDLGNVAWIHDAGGRFIEAVEAYEQSRNIRRRLAESDAKDDYARGRLAYVLDSLARSYSKVGRHADALAHAREAVAIADARRAVDGQNHTELVEYVSGLAIVERAAGRVDASCSAARRARALAAETELAAQKDRILREIAENLGACDARSP
jgi:tetratricopeptide (TPR) repeat protein